MSEGRLHGSKGISRLRAAAAAIVSDVALTHVMLPRTAPPSMDTISTMAVFCMPLTEVKYDGFHLPDTYCAATGGVNSFYVRWLESVGIRVYIMQWDDPWDEKLALLRKVNGVLFPGGDLDHFDALLREYFSRVKEVYHYAIDRALNHNDRFFLWGTCQGFQLLCAAAADDLSVIEGGFCGLECHMLPLELCPVDSDTARHLDGGASPRLLDPTTTPAHVFHALTQAPSTLNVHRYGVSPSAFARGTKLGDAFRVESINRDTCGREFVSTISHRHAAIVAVQWHPEWPPYDFADARVSQSLETISVSNYAAFFIRKQLTRNSHRFDSYRDLECHVIERCPISYEGCGWQFYWSRATRERILVSTSTHDGGTDEPSQRKPLTAESATGLYE